MKPLKKVKMNLGKFMINKKYDRKERGSPRINIERSKS